MVCAELPGSASKMVVMLICKFLRFGSLNSRAQLHHSWKRDEKYRVTVIVLGTEEYTPAFSRQLIWPVVLDSVSLCELVCIDSSCIIPISPSTENVASANSIIPSTIEYMLVDDLKEVFNIILLRDKHHDKKWINITPIKVDGKSKFIGNPQTRGNHAAEVCNMCNPPKVITSGTMNEMERQCAIRDHMASHLIHQPELALGNEPCAYCLGSWYAVVSLNSGQKRTVIVCETVATNTTSPLTLLYIVANAMALFGAIILKTTLKLYTGRSLHRLKVFCQMKMRKRR